jgi:hypothetical protein
MPEEKGSTKLKVDPMEGILMSMTIMQPYNIVVILYFENAEINGDCLGPI